ncbi:hypothetical protein V1478_000067 [Vespula squamosa]|uniref:Uncharacterized protein n=1 Tax=Vespula squamosa TaxID=30214 RepID=A0ABD2C936_VESSQ
MPEVNNLLNSIMMFRNHCPSRIQNCQCRNRHIWDHSVDDTVYIDGKNGNNRICLIHGYNFGASQQIGICIDSVIHSTLAIDYDRRGILYQNEEIASKDQ